MWLLKIGKFLSNTCVILAWGRGTDMYRQHYSSRHKSHLKHQVYSEERNPPAWGNPLIAHHHDQVAHTCPTPKYTAFCHLQYKSKEKHIKSTNSDWKVTHSKVTLNIFSSKYNKKQYKQVSMKFTDDPTCRFMFDKWLYYSFYTYNNNVILRFNIGKLILTLIMQPLLYCLHNIIMKYWESRPIVHKLDYSLLDWKNIRVTVFQ